MCDGLCPLLFEGISTDMPLVSILSYRTPNLILTFRALQMRGWAHCLHQALRTHIFNDAVFGEEGFCAM